MPMIMRNVQAKLYERSRRGLLRRDMSAIHSNYGMPNFGLTRR